MKYNLNLNVLVEDFKNLRQIIIRKLNIKDKNLINYYFSRQSIDARDKSRVLYNLAIVIELDKPIKHKLLTPYKELEDLKVPTLCHKYRPIVIGFGPSGMFCSLYLALAGLKPIIIERGDKVEVRTQKIKDFFDNKILDEESNVVFGEGGAGTFSDGKLQSNIKNEFNRIVLKELVSCGASEKILYSNYPHVGTDVLEKVCVNLRNKIISLGGEFHFNTLFYDYKEEDNLKIVYTKCNNEIITFKSDIVVLGLGHSAFDTISMLYNKGLKIEPKPFSMGVRIEHLQENINISQYGHKYAKMLEAAPYKLACHLPNRSVYTFCMCPGGYVVASQNSKNTIVTNGMSYSARDGVNANSALLVEVKPEDYMVNSPLDGFYFQHKYEALAYNIAKDYRAPANLVKEFLNEEVADNIRTVKPTYPHGIVMSDLNECLPKFIVDSLKEALPLLDHKLHGFADGDAVITAIESRSSSPIKIPRLDYLSNINHLYVIGEGAGHAGGIMTSAIDGLKCALSIINKLK